MSSAWGQSWGSAWGNAWGAIAPIVIADTHDGGNRRKRAWDADQRRRQRRRSQIVREWERLIENRHDEVVAIAQPFMETQSRVVNFDRLLNQIDAVERLHQLLIEIDDEDVLLLL